MFLLWAKKRSKKPHAPRIQPDRLDRRVVAIQNEFLGTKRPLELYQFEGKRFLWIRSKPPVLTNLKTEYLIIGHNSVYSLESLTKAVNFDYLIFDSSNSLRYCERLMAEAEKLHKPCFSVLTQGAFTVNL